MTNYISPPATSTPGYRRTSYISPPATPPLVMEGQVTFPLLLLSHPWLWKDKLHFPSCYHHPLIMEGQVTFPLLLQHPLVLEGPVTETILPFLGQIWPLTLVEVYNTALYKVLKMLVQRVLSLCRIVIISAPTKVNIYTIKEHRYLSYSFQPCLENCSNQLLVDNNRSVNEIKL